MQELLSFLNGLDPVARAEFARRCGTSVGYLRKAISTGHKVGEGLCINIERESAGAIRCEQLRSDVDWAFLRGTSQVRADVHEKAA